jgi:hypothetical protein
MAEEKVVEARMNLAPTPESFRSMAEFVALAEKAAEAAKKTREGFSGHQFGETRNQNPVSGTTQEHSPPAPRAVGFASPNDPLVGISGRFDVLLAQQRDILNAMRNPGIGSPALAPAPTTTRVVDMRHNPDLDEAFGVPTPPTSPVAPRALPATNPGQFVSPSLNNKPGIGTTGTNLERELQLLREAIQRQTETAKRQTERAATSPAAAAMIAPATYGFASREAEEARLAGLGPNHTTYGVQPAESQSTARQAAQSILGGPIPSGKMDRRTIEALRRREGTKDSFGTDANISLRDVQDMMNPGGANRRAMGGRALGMAGIGGLTSSAISALGPAALVAKFAYDSAKFKNEIDLQAGTGATGTEMIRSSAKNIPIIGIGVDAAIGVADTFRGRDTAIKLVQHRQQFRDIEANLQRDAGMARAAVAMDRVPLDAANTVRQADRRFAAVGQIDRSSVGGDIAYRSAETMRPVEQDRIEAERRLAIEQQGMKQLQAQEADTRMKLVQAEKERAKYDPRNEARETGAAGVEYAAKGQQAQTAVDGLTEQLKQLSQRIEQQRGGVGEAQVKLNQVSYQEIQAKLSLGQHKEDSAREQSRRLGAMNPFERAQAQQAAEMVKASGDLDGLSPELVEMARQFAPQEIAKLEEDRGQKFIKDQGLVGGDFKEFQVNLRDQEQAMSTLRDAAAKMQVDLAAQAAKIFAETMLGDAMVKGIVDAIKAGSEKAAFDMLSKLNAQRAAQ